MGGKVGEVGRKGRLEGKVGREGWTGRLRGKVGREVWEGRLERKFGIAVGRKDWKGRLGGKVGGVIKSEGKVVREGWMGRCGLGILDLVQRSVVDSLTSRYLGSICFLMFSANIDF